MKKEGVLLLLIFIFPFCAFSQKGLSSYKKANELYDKQDFKEAAKLFTLAIDSMEADQTVDRQALAKAYNNRGNTYGQSNNLLLALFDYDKSVSLDGKQVDTYINRANIRTSLGNFREAIADLNKALQFKPQSSEIYYQRGLILLLDVGQFSDAEKDLKKANELQANQADVLAYYGLALFELKKYDQALQIINQSIAINKDLPDSYYFRAKIYHATRQKDNALKDINKALELQPQTPEYEDIKQLILKK